METPALPLVIPILGGSTSRPAPTARIPAGLEGSSSTILTGDMGSTGVGGAVELGGCVLPLARPGVVKAEGDSVPVSDSQPDGGNVSDSQPDGGNVSSPSSGGNVSSPSSADGEGGGVGTDLNVQLRPTRSAHGHNA
jgi:hypothetical protein